VSGVRFGHIELFVSDPERSRLFYERALRFEVVTEQAGGFVWLRLGEAEILLRPGEGQTLASSYAEAPSAIVLYTDELAETCERLEAAGVRFRGEDGGCPTFTDPDGHWFQIVDPSAHA
jgi:catechol 2,3-dioxygenase-like lactoylglutathione lyase family enzyme